MVCINPKYIYLRKSYPIEKPCEDDLHKLNKPKWKPTKNFYQIQIPCGECIGCKLDHANEWATRIYCEQKCWSKSICVMLSYNDPHLNLAENGKNTLKKSDLQKFFKRLRKLHKGIDTWTNPQTGKEEKPIRYFACGEYGHNGTREKNGGNPHYHTAIFNWTPTDLKFEGYSHTEFPMYKSKELQKIWGKGLVIVQPLTYENACYIARYVQKKAGIAPQKRKYDYYEDVFGNLQKKILKDTTIPEPEFVEMSTCPGIGRLYWENNKNILKKQNGINVIIGDKVKIKKLPRYFKKQWEKENYEEYDKHKYQNKKEVEKCMEELLQQLDINKSTIKEINEEYKMKVLREQIAQKLNFNAKKLKREVY